MPLSETIPSHPSQRLRDEAEAELARAPPGDTKTRSAEELLHELQVHQIELEMQNETLRQAQATLEESRDRYASLYEFAPVGYLTLTDADLISEINLTGVGLLGEDRKRLLGRRFASFVASDDRDRWQRHFLHALRHAGKQTCELRLVRGDGTTFEANLDCRRTAVDEATPALRIVLTDITARKMAEGELRKRERAIQAMLDALPSTVAVVNRSGLIAEVNETWRRFALENSPVAGQPPRNTEVGASYFDACKSADGNILEEAREAYDGIRAVLEGRLASFSVEYPCHSPDQQRWFLMSVVPLDQEDRAALIAHIEITGSKLAQQALQASEERYRALFSQMHLGFTLREIVTDDTGRPTDCRFLTANEAFLTSRGLKPEDVIGKTLTEIHPDLPSDSTDWIAIYGEVALTGKSVHFEGHSEALGRWFETTAYRTAPKQFAVMATDITERKKAEDEQRRLRRALRLLSDCNLALVRAEDEQTLLSDVCRLVVETGGYRMSWIGFAEHDSGKTVSPVAQFGYADGLLESIRVSWDETLDIGHGSSGAAIRTGKAKVITNYLTNPDAAPWREAVLKRGYQSGVAVPLISQRQTIGALAIYSVKPDDFGAGEVSLLEELARNIAFGIETLRTRGQNKAAQAELQKFKAIVESSDDAIIGKTLDGIITSWNRGAEKIFGYSADEAIGHPMQMLIPPEHLNEEPEILAQISRGESVEHFETVRRCKDGRLIDVSVTISPIRDADGNVIGASKIARDITERKQAEQASRASEERYRALFSHMQSGFALHEILTDDAGEPVNYRFLAANDAFLGMLGQSSDDIVGKTLTEVFPNVPKDSTDWIAIYGKVALTGESVSFQSFSEALQRWFEVTAYRPAPRQFAVLVTDVTEKKHTEAMLVQAQKMEAIGTLAGGIAHDFNNILTSILGFNHLIPGDIGNSEAVANYVRQIDTAGNRAKALVRQILTFSRQQPSQTSPIDLCQIAKEVHQLIGTAAPSTIKVDLDLPPGKAMVMGSTIEMHQILMNLCVNAVDAIGTRHGSISIVLTHRDGGFDLSVTDSGCGIPEEIRSRIFDPFFTTKSATGGTGLGLSVVHGIVEGMGGTISVESPPEGGACFVVRLPELASPAEKSVSKESLPSGQPTVGSRNILVVDDDPLIVELLRRFFLRNGHRVSASTAPSEALGWIKTGERFDLVIADQMMPGTTGIELARAIADWAPGTKVLLCSGREDIIDYDEIAAARIETFVLKPFNLTELADTVERLLEGVDAAV
jgi:PAS domain S-box-containing protein